MASVRHRENTFKIDLSNFPKRPSYEEIHTFVHEVIGLSLGQLKRLQVNHSLNCAHVKCIDLKTALDAVDQHNERHEIDINGKKVKVRLVMDDGGVEVKIHDLSENITNEEIAAYLRQYGDVLSVKEIMWGENFACKGLPSGIRVAKMTLRKHIRSFVIVQGEQTLVTYRNQPQTCKHCNNLAHPGSTCVQNKKLLGQKSDLEKRLRDAQSKQSGNKTPLSYANVLGNKTPANLLMPRFITNSVTESSERAQSMQTMNVVAGAEDSSPRSLSIPPPSSETTVLPAAELAHMDQSEAERNFTSAVAGNEFSSSGESTQQAAKTPVDEPMTEHDVVATSSKQVTKFKVPSNPKQIMEISENECYESSAESGCDSDFQKVKRGRGRPKKIRLDATRPISPLVKKD